MEKRVRNEKIKRIYLDDLENSISSHEAVELRSEFENVAYIISENKSEYEKMLREFDSKYNAIFESEVYEQKVFCFSDLGLDPNWIVFEL